eukprot:TRINITY_DN858_c0_g2_i2.p1 TRINITY_DN858_c0_g2~~TRINITY_DN858_c0_g2_i2.p1  ORF type:complete len:694 (+),score=88.72 TRINITY_DN858_c0_g2_i2:1099-3180(+)
MEEIEDLKLDQSKVFDKLIRRKDFLEAENFVETSYNKAESMLTIVFFGGEKDAIDEECERLKELSANKTENLKSLFNVKKNYEEEIAKFGDDMQKLAEKRGVKITRKEAACQVEGAKYAVDDFVTEFKKLSNDYREEEVEVRAQDDTLTQILRTRFLKDIQQITEKYKGKLDSKNFFISVKQDLKGSIVNDLKALAIRVSGEIVSKNVSCTAQDVKKVKGQFGDSLMKKHSVVWEEENQFGGGPRIELLMSCFASTISVRTGAVDDFARFANMLICFVQDENNDDPWLTHVIGEDEIDALRATILSQVNSRSSATHITQYRGNLAVPVHTVFIHKRFAEKNSNGPFTCSYGLSSVLNNLSNGKPVQKVGILCRDHLRDTIVDTLVGYVSQKPVPVKEFFVSSKNLQALKERFVQASNNPLQILRNQTLSPSPSPSKASPAGPKWRFMGDKGPQDLDPEFHVLYTAMQTLGITQLYYVYRQSAQGKKFKIDVVNNKILDTKGQVMSNLDLSKYITQDGNLKKAVDWLKNNSKVGNQHMIDLWLDDDFEASYWVYEVDLKGLTQKNMKTQKCRQLIPPNTSPNNTNQPPPSPISSSKLPRLMSSNNSGKVELLFPTQRFRNAPPTHTIRISGLKEDAERAKQECEKHLFGGAEIGEEEEKEDLVSRSQKRKQTTQCRCIIMQVRFYNYKRKAAKK